MSTLSTLRESLCAPLGAVGGLSVYGFVPEAIAAPAAIVQPGDPYLTDEGQPYGSFRVQWRITLVADVATNEVATEELDALIEEAVVTLATAGFPVGLAGEPYVFQANDNLHLAVDLTATTIIRF